VLSTATFVLLSPEEGVLDNQSFRGRIEKGSASDEVLTSSQNSWWSAQSASTEQLIPVYILNLDLARSSSLEVSHPLVFKQQVNALQDEIQHRLHEANFEVQGWSGDGLVAIADGRDACSDECVKTAVELLDLFTQIKEKHLKGGRKDWKLVDLRIGLVHGYVPWAAQLGRVVAVAMNIAGHFQKQCPAGSILIDKEVSHRLTMASQYKSRFEQDTIVPHGDSKLEACSLQPPLHDEGPAFPDFETQILEIFKSDGYDVVVRAPAVFYLVGEFDSIFGYPALIMPIPLFSYVGLSLGGAGFQVDEVRVVEAEADAYERRRGLQFVKPTQTVSLDEEERRLLWDTIRDAIPEAQKWKGLRMKNLSMIPTRCGIGASSAFSVALALAADLLANTGAQSALRQSRGYDDAPLLPNGDVRRVFKLAWSLENIPEGGSSSGGGVLTSLFGSRDGFPILYLSDKRGFDGGFPFQFAQGGAVSSFRDPEFDRITGIGFRTVDSVNRERLGLDYALFFTAGRGGKKTGDLVAEFFKQFGHFGKTGVANVLSQHHYTRYGHHREAVVRLARRTHNESLGHELSKKRFKNPVRSATRDLFVEWFAQALGCVSMAAISEFYTFTAGTPERFLRQIDAYQELRSALGIAGTITDYFTDRVELLQYEIAETTRLAPSSDLVTRIAPFGNKLVGTGGGGDFLVLAPECELERRFPMLRRNLTIGGRPPPCHYLSWYSRELQMPDAVPAAWRLTNGVYKEH
jgi:mevalonate kinase